MLGSYFDKIKKLLLYDGWFDVYWLEVKDCDVLFVFYFVGIFILIYIYDIDNYGLIIKGELMLILFGEILWVCVGEWYYVFVNVEYFVYFEVEMDEVEFWFKV